MADPGYIDADGVLTDGEAWVGIATATIDPAAIVTFASTDDGQVGDWSQYMDLVIVAYARGVRSYADAGIQIALNNDTGSNYNTQQLKGDGSSVTSYDGAGRDHMLCGDVPGGSATANQFGACVIHLFDINSGKYKSGFSNSAGDKNGSGWVELHITTWLNQSPITEIDITEYNAYTWAAGSKFSLFGLLPRMVAA